MDSDQQVVNKDSLSFGSCLVPEEEAFGKQHPRSEMRVRRGKKNETKAVNPYHGRGVHLETIVMNRTIEGCEMFWGLPSGDEPHVSIAGVTVHKVRPIRIIEDTNRCSLTWSSKRRRSASSTRPNLSAVRVEASAFRF